MPLTNEREYDAWGGKPGVNWLQVTPEERRKLSGLIEHYRKKPHPFTACVRDNTKRFGPERAKRVCAVLKDLIEGGTGWRKGKGGARSMEEAEPIVLTAEELRAVIEQADAILADVREYGGGEEPTGKKRRPRRKAILSGAGREYAFDPRQRRAPKGSKIGGRWIKLSVLADAAAQMSSPGIDDIYPQGAKRGAAEKLVESGDLRQKPGRDKAFTITPKGHATLARAQREGGPGTPGRAPEARRSPSREPDPEYVARKQAEITRFNTSLINRLEEGRAASTGVGGPRVTLWKGKYYVDPEARTWSGDPPEPPKGLRGISRSAAIEVSVAVEMEEIIAKYGPAGEAKPEPGRVRESIQYPGMGKKLPPVSEMNAAELNLIKNSRGTPSDSPLGKAVRAELKRRISKQREKRSGKAEPRAGSGKLTGRPSSYRVTYYVKGKRATTQTEKEFGSEVEAQKYAARLRARGVTASVRPLGRRRSK